MGSFQIYPRRAYHRVPKFSMGSLVIKILRFQSKEYLGDPPNKPILVRKWLNFKSQEGLSKGSKTFEGLGEMFEGDSADTCNGKFSFNLMGVKQRVSVTQTRE